MRNLTLTFSHPWLLLLIVPAIALVLIPYFFLSKKYRRTRNRIVSMVLHSIVMVLAILVLSGMRFEYQVSNDENEIILLVDVSDTQEEAFVEVKDGQNITRIGRDDFLQTVLDMGSYDGYKIGVVTFGFNQKYAVPLTYNINTIYDKYVEAELPDTSATDIAAAINYAKGLFTNPEFGKIVLITDGVETDETASDAIRAAAAQGIVVDTVRFGSSFGELDVQITGVTLPDYHLTKGDECEITLSVQSGTDVVANIQITDNGKPTSEEGITALLKKGAQNITIKHVFENGEEYGDGEFHELNFSLTLESKDAIQENNLYTSAFYLEIFNKVLVFESMEGQSEKLVEILEENNAYKVRVINVNAGGDVPATVDELRAYDQIIMNNISNEDLAENEHMPAGFVDMLYSYVYDYGGGLFTVGGDDEDGENHAYDRGDMYGKLYQEMLPVQAINYTPPIGVIVIIDRSGSMSGEKLAWAQDGAASCLDALSERDYFGLMTLDNTYEMILPMTPRTQEDKIRSAINSVNTAMGGTMFPEPVARAGEVLKALKDVDKRHIIIVTDGQVPDNERADYEAIISKYNKSDDITLSVVAIGMAEESGFENATPDDLTDPKTPYQKMLRAVLLGKGRLYALSNDTSAIVRAMREDLRAPEITEKIDKDFNPTIRNTEFTSAILNGVERGLADEENEEDVNLRKLTVKLNGYYGVRVRSNDYLVLAGDYNAPLYAQWKFGKGKVGSFMCDLYGNRSADFVDDANGRLLVTNIVKTLMPVSNIRPNEINVVLEEGNYINRLSIYADLKNGETIRGQLVNCSTEETSEISLNQLTPENEIESGASVYVTLALDEATKFSRCDFIVKETGVYRLVLTKLSADGTPLATFEAYKEFSYSKEYDVYNEETAETLTTKLQNWAMGGRGSFVEDLENPSEIFEDFITAIKKIADPRIAFLIIAIVLFLGDIAVRKFKFKWPHELIREHNEKKKTKDQNKN